MTYPVTVKCTCKVKHGTGGRGKEVSEQKRNKETSERIKCGGGFELVFERTTVHFCTAIDLNK